MKSHSRNFLAATLTLGAAVFAFSAEALECLEPVGIGNRPVSVAAISMTNYAAKKIAESHSVFRGRIVSTKHLYSTTPYEAAFLVTYKVSEWKKGSGRPYAKFTFHPWCDGECAINETIKNLMSYKEDRFYIVGSQKEASSQKAAAKIKNLEGSTYTCDQALSKLPIRAERPYLRYHMAFGEFLYELAMASEIEKMPSLKAQ